MKYTAALIGCGRIGFSLGLDKKREQPSSHTMALQGNSHIKLIAGCDTNEIHLSEWQKYTKINCFYEDSANLYARHTPDIIAIAVNESAHMKEAFDAIHAKPKLIILEKPVALNMNEAEKIRIEAEKNNIPILINHERRFASDFKAAKKYLPKIGELQSIKASLYSNMVAYSPDEEKTGAYSLIHDGTHLVDAVLYFLEDEEPSARKIVPYKVDTPQQKGLLNAAKSSITAKVKYRTVNTLLNSPVITGICHDENKNIRQFTANYTSEKCPDISISISGRSRYFGFEITITGTEGRICIGNGYLKFYKREKSTLYTGFCSLRNDRLAKVPKKTRYFSNMVQNGVDFLNGKKKLASTIENGINALAVLEEIKSKLKCM